MRQPKVFDSFYPASASVCVCFPPPSTHTHSFSLLHIHFDCLLPLPTRVVLGNIT
eukprot:m.126128 g.126128  ORF g.126128 m.126128 type:complete len:55 (+) comp13818_c1_seq5:1041-1205(+)